MWGVDELIEQARRLGDAGIEMASAGIRDLAATPQGLRGDDPDEWDPEYIRRTMPALRPLFDAYFRAEVEGLDNIPDGPALLVGNHSGGLYIADTFVLTLSFYGRFGPERRFHQLAHDLATRLPVGGWLRRYGTLAASHENARAAFRRNAPVLVYPGGDHETFRPSWQSDEVQFSGRQGFCELALEEGVPIVPVVSAGGQETALFLTRGKRLARVLMLDRLFRIKVLPIAIAPPFGLSVLDMPMRIPLPAKIEIEIGEPIDLKARFGPDPEPQEVYEGIRGQMQQRLDRLEAGRTAPVVG